MKEVYSTLEGFDILKISKYRYLFCLQIFKNAVICVFSICDWNLYFFFSEVLEASL